MALVWDLETIALDASMAAPYPEADRNPPANYSKPEAIQRWREKDQAEWQTARVKECSLNPRLGRIVCVAKASEREGVVANIAQTESEEALIVADLWRAIDDENGEIITFNGGSFDVPYLLTRSLILGVTPTVPVRTIRDWTRRYSYGPHYDVRSVLTQWDSRASGTLTDWCQALGIPCSDTAKGSDVWDMYQARDFDGIAAHAKSDVQITKQLYDSVSSVYGGLDSKTPATIARAAA